jgi:hypothetical protein
MATDRELAANENQKGRAVTSTIDVSGVGFVLGINAQRLCTGVRVGEEQENVIRERAIVDKGRGNEKQEKDSLHGKGYNVGSTWTQPMWPNDCTKKIITENQSWSMSQRAPQTMQPSGRDRARR